MHQDRTYSHGKLGRTARESSRMGPSRSPDRSGPSPSTAWPPLIVACRRLLASDEVHSADVQLMVQTSGEEGGRAALTGNLLPNTADLSRDHTDSRRDACCPICPPVVLPLSSLLSNAAVVVRQNLSICTSMMRVGVLCRYMEVKRPLRCQKMWYMTLRRNIAVVQKCITRPKHSPWSFSHSLSWKGSSKFFARVYPLPFGWGLWTNSLLGFIHNFVALLLCGSSLPALPVRGSAPLKPMPMRIRWFDPFLSRNKCIEEKNCGQRCTSTKFRCSRAAPTIPSVLFRQIEMYGELSVKIKMTGKHIFSNTSAMV